MSLRKFVESTTSLVPISDAGLPNIPGVLVRDHPLDNFSPRPIHEGATLAEMLKAQSASKASAKTASKAIILLDGKTVPEILWSSIIPKAGANIKITLHMVHGDGSDILRTVLSIALVVFAAWLGPAAAGWIGLAKGGTAAGLFASAVTGVTFVVGSLIINAIVPPVINELSTPSTSYRIEAARNEVRPGLAARLLVGEHRVFPESLGAYREIIGNDVYLRQVFRWTTGEIDLSQLKIGDTDIASFDNVEIESRTRFTDPSHSLFTDDPSELSVGALLEAGNWVRRTTQTDTEEIAAIISFAGLGLIDDQGREQGRTVNFNFRYRPVGETIWQTAAVDVPGANQAARNAGTDDRDLWFNNNLTIEPWILEIDDPGANGSISFSGNETRAQILKVIRFAVPKAQYEFELQRSTADSTDPKIVDKASFSVLQSWARRDVVPNRNDATTAIRIKATDQLSGAIDSFNAVAIRVAPVLSTAAQNSINTDPNFDFSTLSASSWSDKAPSVNPADNFLFAQRGPQTPRPMPNNLIDWPEMGRWWKLCQDAGYRVSGVLSGETRRDAALRLIAGAGRAAALMAGDGRLTVVSDAPKPAAGVTLFTAQNTRNFKWRRTYAKEVHGLRTQFADRANGWRTTERVTYADGYDESNSTLIERFDQPLQDDADLVWKHARFGWATATLQPETFTFEISWEQLALNFGDRVKFQHPVMVKGIGNGALVKELVQSGGNVTAIKTSEVFGMLAGKTYGLIWRYPSGGSSSGSFETADEIAIVTLAGNNSTLTFETPLSLAVAPAIGDMIAFGETNLVVDEGLIKNIRRIDDEEAEITCVAYAPARYGADTGSIPAFDPGLTLPFQPLPATPLAANVLASTFGASVSFSMANGAEVGITGFVIRTRAVDDLDQKGEWRAFATLSANERSVDFPNLAPAQKLEVEITAFDNSERMGLPLLVDVTGSSLLAPVNLVIAQNSLRVGTSSTYKYGLIVSADPVVDTRLRSFEVETQIAGSGLWDKPGGETPASNPLVVTGLIGSLLTLDVRARFVPNSGAPSVWTVIANAIMLAPQFAEEASPHLHSEYLSITGGTITGNLVVQQSASDAGEVRFRDSTLADSREIHFKQNGGNLEVWAYSSSISPPYTLLGTIGSGFDFTSVKKGGVPVYNSNETDTAITTAIDALVAASPGALDTLNELAAALGDDPNFASTMTTALAAKLDQNGAANLKINKTDAQIDLVDSTGGQPRINLRTGGRYDRIINTPAGFELQYNYSGAVKTVLFDGGQLSVNGSTVWTAASFDPAGKLGVNSTSADSALLAGKNSAWHTNWDNFTNLPASFPSSAHLHSEYLSITGGNITGNLVIQQSASDAGEVRFRDSTLADSREIHFKQNGGNLEVWAYSSSVSPPYTLLGTIGSGFDFTSVKKGGVPVYNSNETDTAITTAIDALVAASPGALDTLNELAAALGDDPNFASTMTTALAGKLAVGATAADSDLLAGVPGSDYALVVDVTDADASLAQRAFTLENQVISERQLLSEGGDFASDVSHWYRPTAVGSSGAFVSEDLADFIFMEEATIASGDTGSVVRKGMYGGDNQWHYTRFTVPVDTSRTYKMRIKVLFPIGVTGQFYAGVATLDDNYDAITGGAGSHRYFAAYGILQAAHEGTIVDFEGTITGEGALNSQFRPGTTRIRLMFICSYQDVPAPYPVVLSVSFIDTEDLVLVNSRIDVEVTTRADVDVILQTNIDSKLSTSGGTITGNLVVQQSASDAGEVRFRDSTLADSREIHFKQNGNNLEVWTYSSSVSPPYILRGTIGSGLDFATLKKGGILVDNSAEVDAKIAALVDSSPAALDTLNELASALDDDPNFATTMTNSLAGKLDVAATAADSALLGGENSAWHRNWDNFTNLPNRFPNTNPTLTDAATITIDLSGGVLFSVTLTANRTLANPTGIVAGQVFYVAVKKNAVGRTLSFGSYYKGQGGSLPTLTTYFNGHDLLKCYVISTTEIWVELVDDFRNGPPIS